MGNDFYYAPVQLRQALEQITGMHLSLVETPGPEREKKVDGFLKEMQNIGKSEFRQFASGVRRKDVDLVLYALKRDSDKDTRVKLMYILGHCRHKSLFSLNWNLLQGDYHNTGLLESMELFCRFMKKRYQEEYRQSLPCRVEGNWKELLYKSYQILKEEALSPREFMDKYEILEDSPLAQDLCIMFFSECNVDGFTDNKEMFFRVIQNHNSNNLHIAMDNYLKNFEDTEFNNEVNSFLLERYGDPREDNPLWLSISSIARMKFLQWFYVKEMERYFEKGSKKFRFWREYSKKVRKVARREEQDQLVIYLDGLVIVESGREEKECFLYSKEVSDWEYPDGGGMQKGGQMVIPKGAVTARDAILENLESDVYILSLESVGKLYAVELLKRELEKS